MSNKRLDLKDEDNLDNVNLLFETSSMNDIYKKYILEDEDLVRFLKVKHNLTDSTEVDTSIATAKSETLDSLKTGMFSSIIETPTNTRFSLILNIPFEGIITKISFVSSSGTCGVAFDISGSTITGSAGSVSNTKNSVTPTANEFGVGDDINVNISENDTATRVLIVIEYERTF